MTKLLFVATALDIGGVQRSLLNLLFALSPEEYAIDLLLVKPGGELEHQLPAHVRVIAFPAKDLWVFMSKDRILSDALVSLGPNLNFLFFARRLLDGILNKRMGAARQKLMKERAEHLSVFQSAYDVAIDYTGNYKGYLLSKVSAKRKISWVHGDYRTFPRDQAIDKEDYDALDAIVTVSRTCKDVFDDVFPECRDKTYVMQNITSSAMVHDLALAEEDPFQKEPERIDILDITRLDPDKGLEIAIDACKILVQNKRKVRWHILGDGPYRSVIEKMIEQRGLTGVFVLLGSQSNPYPYIKSADLIVHCSRFEGRSVAIDEAMLLAKPIIVTDYPTAKDQIENDVNGIICAMNPQAVSATVERVLDNDHVRDRLVANLATFKLPTEASIDVFRKVIA